jgi:hypothetical protein
MSTHPPFASPAVEDVFKSAPRQVQTGMHRLRDLIFEVAHDIDSDLTVSETRKWGQPSFVVQGGSPLRVAPRKDGGFALYAICQTSLIGDFAETFPNMDKIEGTRAVLFDDTDDIDDVRHGLLIRHALTYHRKATS